MKLTDLTYRQLDDFYAAISIIKNIMIEHDSAELSAFVNDYQDDSLISFRIYFEGLQKKIEKDLVDSNK